MSNFHLQEIETLQNSLRERQEYVTQLENRLRALWDKYYVDQKHYTDRIKRLEEAGDTMANAYRQICYDAYDDQQVDNWFKAKEAKP